jgi:hypothetical protein
MSFIHERGATVISDCRWISVHIPMRAKDTEEGKHRRYEYMCAECPTDHALPIRKSFRAQRAKIPDPSKAMIVGR